MSTALSLPSLSSESGLSHYLAAIRRFPLLTAEQELDLGRRWQEQGDRAAAHTLVTSHLRLVAKIAMGYRGYNLSLADIIAEGNVGLMQAVKKFDPSKGFRLATYAMWWIKASIHEYILHNWSLVKIGTTAAQKKLFFNLRKIKNQLQAVENGDLTAEHVTAIATQLDVSENEVVDMNRRLSGRDSSLNAIVGHDGDDEHQDFIMEPAPSHETLLVEHQENTNRNALLITALQQLNDREKAIFTARRLRDEPATLETLSQSYGISRERVRQIEQRAFEKIQSTLLGQKQAA